MEISEKPKKTRQRKTKDTAFDEEKAKLKKTLKKKPLKDDEEPLEFDLPDTIPKSEPILIKIISETPPTSQNSYKTPVKNFILYNEYIY